MADWYPLRLSMEVGTVATGAALVLGLPLAVLLARRKLPAADWIDALVTLPLVLPPTVLGYYLLVVFGRRAAMGRLFERVTGSPLTFTVAGAVVAATVHALPTLVRASRAAVEAVDPALEDAARVLGAGELRVLASVTLPLASRGIAAAAALAFARALGDFGVTLMVAGNIPRETQTAALAIYDAVQAGRDADARALVWALSALAVGLLVLSNRVGRRDLGAWGPRGGR